MYLSTENKKAFDPTTCFTFYGSWLKAIEKLETEQDRNSIAYKIFKAIANYSMYDEEPDFDNPVLTALWLVLEREIDSSVQKRKQGFAKDMINDNYQKIIQAVIDNPSASLRDIGTMTGTNKNMVDRVKKKYKTQIDEAISDRVNVSYNASNSVLDTNTNTVIDNDSVGQDNGTESKSETTCNIKETAVVVDDEVLSDWIPVDNAEYSDDDMPF